MFEEIPSLDLHHFTKGNDEQRKLFAKNLGKAYQEIGFVAIKNHGLSDDLVEKLYTASKQFFALDDVVKSKYDIKDLAGQRGYTGKGKEHAKGHNTGDLKEFYHVGQEIEENIRKELNYPANVWPQEIPEFEAVLVEAYRTLEKTGIEMLRAIALYLNLDEHYFDDKVKYGNSILRAIHYFPILNPDNVPVDAVRAAEHGDINLITLLMGASADGLQILRNDGKWIAVTALPDQIVVNVGDMLARLTNEKLKSTIHRVVNPPKSSMHLPRYSIPFFMHPKASVDLSCLPNCVSNENPKKFPDITAGEFLDQRLREIGLKK